MRELCERTGIVLQDRKMKSRIVVEGFLKTTQFKYRKKKIGQVSRVLEKDPTNQKKIKSNVGENSQKQKKNANLETAKSILPQFQKCKKRKTYEQTTWDGERHLLVASKNYQTTNYVHKCSPIRRQYMMENVTSKQIKYQSD